MRKFAASVIVVLTVAAFATADEFMGVVTKFEDGKITFTSFMIGGGGGAKGEATTMSVAANAKFLKGKVNIDGGFSVEADGDYEGGKDAFAKAVKEAGDKKKDDKKADDKKADDKKGAKGGKGGFGGGGLFGGGVFAQIITEGEGDKAKVTEIRVINLGNFKKK